MHATEGFKNLIQAIIFDLKEALRSFTRRPVIPTIVILVLAVAIGSSTAVFTLFDNIVLRPITVKSPKQLLSFWDDALGEQGTGAVSMPMVRALRAKSRELAGLAAHTELEVSAQIGGRPEQFVASVVTGNYFQVLGVNAVRGRTIVPADETLASGATYAVISDVLWSRQFRRSADAIGSSIRVMGNQITVIGVAPPSFRGTDLSAPVDLWLPLGMLEKVASGPLASPNILNDWYPAAFKLIGRVSPSSTVARAAAEIHTLGAVIDAYKPRVSTDGTHPSARMVVPSGKLEARSLNAGAVIRGRGALLLFLTSLGATIFICLLIACVNVANLMMIRTAQRIPEIALRMAIGAPRHRLASQLFIEHLVIGVLSGVLGLLIALFSMRVLANFSMPGGIDISQLYLGINSRVLIFCATIAFLSSILFGITPVLAGLRGAVFGVLQNIRHGSGKSPIRSGAFWVATQVAMSIILVALGSMFIRSMRAAMNVDLGYRVEGLATLSVGLEQNRYTVASAPQFIARLEAAARRNPRIRDFAVALDVPISPHKHPQPVSADDNGGELGVNVVSGTFFGTLGMHLLSGRVFNDSDRDGTSAVSIVTASAASKLWPDADPIGKELLLYPGVGPLTRVVGVVSDAHFTSLENKMPFMFMPIAQQVGRLGQGMKRIELVGRAANGESSIKVLRDLVHGVDPSIPITHETTLKGRLDTALMPQRFGSMILTLFGGLSLLISAIGIYSVAGYEVAHRRRELGIRAALGANQAALITAVMRRSGTAVAAGCVVGVGVAFLAANAVSGYLFNVTPSGPASYVLAASLLASVGLVASLGPARSAGAIDPLQIIRE